MGVIALDAAALILVGFGALLAGFTTGLLGSWIGARLYKRISAKRFRRLVLALLLLSGTILIVQAFGV